MGVIKAIPGRRLLNKSARIGKCRGYIRKVFLLLHALTLFFPFPVQLPRDPLLVSAYYVLGLRFITVNP